MALLPEGGHQIRWWDSPDFFPTVTPLLRFGPQGVFIMITLTPTRSSASFADSPPAR